MATRIPVYRPTGTTTRVGTLVAGQNVTVTEQTVGGNVQVVIGASGGGGGGGAPTDAKYLTLGTNATLTEERVLAPSARFAVTDGGAGGNYVLDFASAGTAGTYAYPVSLTTDAYGRVTAVTGGSAPVASTVAVDAGELTNTGTSTAAVLGLANAGTAGTYAYPASITTDAFGRVTNATAGSAPPSPASSVVTETSYGQSSATGTSSNYAREDHTHGTVALPAHSSTTGLAWASAGHTGSSTAVATWDGNGSAAVVQATADETMLVRRAGTLQWVPLVSALSILSGELVLEGGFIANDPVALYTGTFV